MWSLLLITSPVLQAFLTAPPKVYRPFITHSVSCVNGETSRPVSCSIETTPLPTKTKKKGKQQKNTSLNPELSCAHSNGCQNPMSIKPLASWRVRTFKFVRQHCKLCVQSCFDSFWFFVDVRLHNIFLFCFLSDTSNGHCCQIGGLICTWQK